MLAQQHFTFATRTREFVLLVTLGEEGIKVVEH
jgi:hypothetical protein